MKIDRCPHCDSIPRRTMARVIENRLNVGHATMDQIKASARKINPKATNKQIYNVLAMLTRYKRIKRYAYGVYTAIR